MKVTPLFIQDSICPKSAPVGDTPSTPRKGSNGLSSPAKSVERSQSTEEQKTAKVKPPALNNITSEATSTMSPPPAKKLALSAKKVIVSTASCHCGNSRYLYSCCLTPHCYPTFGYRVGLVVYEGLPVPPFSLFSSVCNV